MFIPVFDRIGSHWYLIVVLPSDKKVEIWDSLPGPKYNAGRYQQAERIVSLIDVMVRLYFYCPNNPTKNSFALIVL